MLWWWAWVGLAGAQEADEQAFPARVTASSFVELSELGEQAPAAWWPAPVAPAQDARLGPLLQLDEAQAVLARARAVQAAAEVQRVGWAAELAALDLAIEAAERELAARGPGTPADPVAVREQLARDRSRQERVRGALEAGCVSPCADEVVAQAEQSFRAALAGSVAALPGGGPVEAAWLADLRRTSGAQLGARSAPLALEVTVDLPVEREMFGGAVRVEELVRAVQAALAQVEAPGFALHALSSHLVQLDGQALAVEAAVAALAEVVRRAGVGPSDAEVLAFGREAAGLLAGQRAAGGTQSAVEMLASEITNTPGWQVMAGSWSARSHGGTALVFVEPVTLRYLVIVSTAPTVAGEGALSGPRLAVLGGPVVLR